MPLLVSDARFASGSLTRGAAGAVSARHRQKASSADAEPCGTRSRRVAAARDASTNGAGPAAFDAAAGRFMKTGTSGNATDSAHTDRDLRDVCPDYNHARWRATSP